MQIETDEETEKTIYYYFQRFHDFSTEPDIVFFRAYPVTILKALIRSSELRTESNQLSSNKIVDSWKNLLPPAAWPSARSPKLKKHSRVPQKSFAIQS